MTKSRGERRWRWRRFPVAILVVVIATVLVAYAFLFPPNQGQVVLNFSLEISVQVSEHLQNGTNVIHFLTTPGVGIGVPGGTWRANTYDSYGSGNYYPIYVLPLVSNNYSGNSRIYVKSTVNRTYTLADLFSVWGEPLGPNNTLGFTTPPPSGQTTFPSTWYWDICVGVGQGALQKGLWGNEPLTAGKSILLLYSDVGCLG